MRIEFLKRTTFLISPVLLFLGCNSYDPVPKPTGYLRIDLPEKSYRAYESDCPFTFDYPTYAEIITSDPMLREKCWMNINFPAFKGNLHVSYKPVTDNLQQYLEDSYQFKVKHMSMATAFEDSLITDPERKVYGMAFQIKGERTASPYQFFLTDSVHHFLRASLYFRVSPNNDSLAPVIDFLEKDFERMISSFRWKENETP
ncbi:MAG: hypothetical protein KDD36_00485 [Flavobacteriales bacterium]|nr:hypothetical protein [Flavobacteriales bacterium]